MSSEKAGFFYEDPVPLAGLDSVRMWNRISTDFVRDLSLNPEEESKTYELLVDVLKKIKYPQ